MYAVKLQVLSLHENVTGQTEDKSQIKIYWRGVVPGEYLYISIIVPHVLHSCRWWYRQPADHSPWGAVEDAGSASTAAVNTLPLFPASHHATTLPQSGPLTLLRPHGWVASHPSIPHTPASERFISVLSIVCKVVHQVECVPHILRLCPHCSGCVGFQPGALCSLLLPCLPY